MVTSSAPETAGVARGPAGMASEPDDRSPGGPRLEEPAHPAVLDHGVGEHHVEA